MDSGDLYPIRVTGLMTIGTWIRDLEWAVEVVSEPSNIAGRLGMLTWLSYVYGFQDIGQSIASVQDYIANLKEMTEEAKSQLRTNLTRWRAIVEERSGRLFLLTPNTVFDPKKLMAGIAGVAPAEALESIVGGERSDLDEACRCILVGSTTAGEFMALRAVESMLRRWYTRHASGSPKSIEDKPWGYVIDKLSKEYEGKQLPPELTVLSSLKLRRNEVAHPDKISTLADAQSTLLIACSLPNRLSLPPQLGEPQEAVLAAQQADQSE